MYLFQVHFKHDVARNFIIYIETINIYSSVKDGEIMKEKEKHLGPRLDEETHRKLKSLSEFEGRSINGEVIYLIRQANELLRGKPSSIFRDYGTSVP